MKKAPLITKNDIILALVLLLLGFGSLAFLHAPGKDAAAVEIYLDGALYAEYPLSEDRVETIETANGYNTMEIKDGQVWVSGADCSGRDCVRMGKISKAGQIIMCLPHRLSVRIVSASPAVDGVTY